MVFKGVDEIVLSGTDFGASGMDITRAPAGCSRELPQQPPTIAHIWGLNDADPLFNALMLHQALPW